MILNMYARCVLFVVLLYSALAFGQKPEYDFYVEFRNVFTPKVRSENPSVTKDQIVEAYETKLSKEGVPESEIVRRISLLRTKRHVLERATGGTVSCLVGKKLW